MGLICAAPAALAIAAHAAAPRTSARRTDYGAAVRKPVILPRAAASRADPGTGPAMPLLWMAGSFGLIGMYAPSTAIVGPPVVVTTWAARLGTAATSRSGA